MFGFRLKNLRSPELVYYSQLETASSYLETTCPCTYERNDKRRWAQDWAC